ncbi:unnamed protein product, partial [Chrysoparadoxa australica]
IDETGGRLAVVVSPEGTLSPGARRLNRLTKGALGRAVESEAFGKLDAGDAMTLAWPSGLIVEALDIVKLARRPATVEARKAGGTLARLAGKAALTVLVEATRLPEEIALGVALRSYAFTARKSKPDEAPAAAVMMVKAPDEAEAAFASARAVAEGVAFTRDLVSEPANVLSTTEFAARLEALRDTGLEVEVLEEDKLAELGMGALLGVGMGSAMPAKVGVMRWKGAEGAPLA